METFSWNALTSISSLVAIVIGALEVFHFIIKWLMIWRSKCHQNNPPVVCDGYVKYEEAEVDRLRPVHPSIRPFSSLIQDCQ